MIYKCDVTQVFLRSDLISGYVTVGICPYLPVKGVSLLLGNNLADNIVIINPYVSSHPCSREGTDAEMQDTPGLYPVCVVTRAMVKKQPTAIRNSQNKKGKSDTQSQQSVCSAAEGPPDVMMFLNPTWID